MNQRIPEEEDDIEELREVFGVLSEKVPALLNSLTDVLFGPEASQKFAQAVSNFYKSLRESGMEEEQAFELTKRYMSNMDIAGMVSKLLSKPPWQMSTEVEEAEKPETGKGPQEEG